MLLGFVQSGPADVLDAAFYAIEGDWTNVGFSLIGAIPAVGDLVKLRKVVRTANQVLERAKAAETIAHGVSKHPDEILYRWGDVPEEVAKLAQDAAKCKMHPDWEIHGVSVNTEPSKRFGNRMAKRSDVVEFFEVLHTPTQKTSRSQNSCSSGRGF